MYSFKEENFTYEDASGEYSCTIDDQHFLSPNLADTYEITSGLSEDETSIFAQFRIRYYPNQVSLLSYS